ncbi:Alpha/Beta hydrolase protein [Gloeopeniophorella convolvens]|nr:Alpha/Beta hydrolase protein [Gloeopeniophorella convolvens]
MVHQFRRQPLKGLYLLYELIATTFFRLPYWVCRNSFRSLRPRTSWSLLKAVLIRVVQRSYLITARVGGIKISQGTNVKHVWLNPTPDLLNDKLRACIPGYWVDRKDLDTPVGTAPRPGEKVIYSLHGGAYTRYSASPDDINATILNGLLKYCDGPPEHAFPAALLDALAGYAYLVQTVGFAPEDIILEGDSAGGNLALALTRYLVENVGRAGLPAPPGAQILLSPWVNLAPRIPLPGSRAAANINADYVVIPSVNAYSRRAYLGPHDELDPYISPGNVDPRMPHVSFDGFPRSLVIAGGAEFLIDEIAVLVERMKRDMGEKVAYYEAPDAVHDYLLFLWAEPERTATLQEISRWLRVA